MANLHAEDVERRLDGQVALVTGAGRGIGRACALRLAAIGARVAVIDVDLHSYEEFESERSLTSGATTADAIRRRGGEAREEIGDVTDPESIAACVAHTVEQWGRIDVLVCNAGGGIGTDDESKASDLNLADFDTVLRRNLYGTVNTCIATAPIMKAQRSGKIITLSSQAARGRRAGGGYSHYGTAKAGIAMYTNYLAQDLGPHNVTANCIAPGFIGTGRLMVRFEAAGVEAVESRIALGRLGTADDVAKVVEFLSVGLSDYITGAVIPIDGGSR